MGWDSTPLERSWMVEQAGMRASHVIASYVLAEEGAWVKGWSSMKATRATAESHRCPRLDGQS